MRLDQLFGERQAEPRTFVFSRQAAVDLTQGLKGSSYFVRPHPNAAIADGQKQAVVADRGVAF